MSGWAVLAGSSAGADHDRAGTCSQDAYATTSAGGTLVIAVADGAGGAPMAAVGAALAVETAVREASPDIRPALRRTLRRFHRAVRGLAGATRFRTGDFATTLTVVVARPPWLSAYVIGDGFVVVRAGRNAYDLFLGPRRSVREPLGATTLLPVRGIAAARIRTARIDDLTGVAVGTDGLETLVIAGDRPVAEPFDRLFGLADDPSTNPSALTRLLAGRVVGDLTTDDRTLILAVPR